MSTFKPPMQILGHPCRRTGGPELVILYRWSALCGLRLEWFSEYPLDGGGFAFFVALHFKARRTFFVVLLRVGQTLIPRGILILLMVEAPSQ